MMYTTLVVAAAWCVLLPVRARRSDMVGPRSQRNGRLSAASDGLDSSSAPAVPDGLKSIFSYGTLRGDYSPEGDFWKFIKNTGASWRKATVSGFKLYQDASKYYPFAMYTGNPSDKVTGTLIEYESARFFDKALSTADEIEEYDPMDFAHSLYDRKAVVARPLGGNGSVPALVYFQKPDDIDERVHSGKTLNFPEGDWLKARVAAQREAEKLDKHVTSIFTYGTLRGDYAPEGDYWNFIQKTGATWRTATVPGFKLYQDVSKYYPFATYTGDRGDQVTGTLIEYGSVADFKKARELADEIEEYDPTNVAQSLYDRRGIDIFPSDGSVSVRAFVYFQKSVNINARLKAKETVEFPSGNWLKARKLDNAKGLLPMRARKHFGDVRTKD